MQESFSPKQLFLKKIHLWWLPFVLGCIGAVIGIILSLLIPGQYEAIAEINLAVDFSKTGIVTDIEQDQMIEMVGDICKSDQVFSEVSETNPGISKDDFVSMASLERRNTQWVLKVRHSNASVASELAGLWQAISFREIQAAYEHAIIVDSLSDYLNSLSGCFEQSVGGSTGATSCNLLTIPELQEEMKKVAEQITEEQRLSQGISPAISVSITNEGVFPVRQVSGSKIWSILAGGFIGFLIGIWGIVILNKQSVH